MSPDARRLLWLCAALATGATGASCSLNPQPALPDSDDDGSVTVPPTGGKASGSGGQPDLGLGGNLNTGNQTSAEGGDSAESGGDHGNADHGGEGGATTDGGAGGSTDGGAGDTP